MTEAFDSEFEFCDPCGLNIGVEILVLFKADNKLDFS